MGARSILLLKKGVIKKGHLFPYYFALIIYYSNDNNSLNNIFVSSIGVTTSSVVRLKCNASYKTRKSYAWGKWSPFSVF
jgi:hypothetical protein